MSPLVRSGGGLKNRRFPPPHPSHDNVLYSIFAPCLVATLHVFQDLAKRDRRSRSRYTRWQLVVGSRYCSRYSSSRGRTPSAWYCTVLYCTVQYSSRYSIVVGGILVGSSIY